MSSDQLALKYRPTIWKEVIGQGPVVRSLKGTVLSGSNHTIVLAGPSGVGKTTLARVAAIALEVELRSGDEINAAKLTGVDDMRQIVDTLNYRPLGGGKRLIILDECHMISKAGWNSLLKPLEEPPEWLYWFLCTTDPDRLPATVLTRAITYTLKSIQLDELREHLEWIAGEEGIDLGKEDDSHDIIIELCAKQASGSLRAGINNLAACIGAKTKEAARELLKAAGELEENQAIDLARALMQGKDWGFIREILEGLDGKDVNSIRHVVRGYMTTVVMGGKKNTNTEQCLAILEAFSKPFPMGEQMTPLILACAGLCFQAEED